MASKALTALVKHNLTDGRVFSRQSATLIAEITALSDEPVTATAAGYYTAATGGTKVSSSDSSTTKYLRFTLNQIPKGTVLTLKAGSHGTPRNGYYTDFTVIEANGAVDSSNGVRTRLYGDGVPDKTITLTFNNDIVEPKEFVIGINIWNYIYTMDKYDTNCTNYVYNGDVALVAEYMGLHW